MTGAIAQNASGGSISFVSNNNIYQPGAVTVAANTSGAASSVTYDTRSGNQYSIINTGVLTVAAGSTSPVNYVMESAGSPLIPSGAISVSGSITLDNTFQALGGTTSGYLNKSTVTTANTTTSTYAGVAASNLTAGGNITLNGVYAGVSNVGGVSVNAGTISGGQNTLSGAGSVTISGFALPVSGALSAPVLIAGNNTINSGSSTVAGGGVNMFAYTPSTGISALYQYGGIATINAYGSNVNIGTTANPIYGGAAIYNNPFGTITATTVGGVGGNVSMVATSTGPYNAIQNSGAIVAQGSVTQTGTATSNPATVIAQTGNVTSGTGYTVTGTGGASSSPTVSITGAITNTTSGNISITGNDTAAGAYTGVSVTNSVTQNGNGGSIYFVSNNSISQTGAVSVAANTSGTASNVTYDTTTGNKTSTITSGALTIGTGSTIGINYTQKTAGAPISINSSVSVPGYILLDNTYGGTTPASGFITASNLATYATTSNGVNVYGTNTLTSGAYGGTTGVTVNAISNGGIGFNDSAAITSATAINLTGTSTTNIAMFSRGQMTANTITILGVDTGNAVTVVDTGAITINAGGGALSVTGTEGVAGGGSNLTPGSNNGIYQYGPIVDNSNGGSISYVSNGQINQLGAISLAANTSGSVQTITFDTTSGGTTPESTYNASINMTDSITSAGNSATSSQLVTMKANGIILSTGGITNNGTAGTTGPLNVTAQSFYSGGNLGPNIYVNENITTKGGNLVLDGTGGTISGSTITPGTITNGAVVLGLAGAIAISTSGGSTAGTGNIAIAGSASTNTPLSGVNNYAALLTQNATITAGGSFNANVTTSGSAAQYGYEVASGATTSPITAYGNLSITSNTTATALAAAPINVTSALTSTNGAVSLTSTSSNTSQAAINVTAPVTAVAGVTMTGTSTNPTSNVTGGNVIDTALISNTGSTGGVTLSATGNLNVANVTNAGSSGMSLTGGNTIAAGTVTGGTITGVGTLTNTGGVISLSMAQPESVTGGAIEAAAGITSANASINTNVAYSQVGGVMAAPSKSTLNNVNYRIAISPTTINVSEGAYNQVYGTAYNSTTANNWVESATNSTITSITGSFGKAPTTALALASLLFNGTVGSAATNANNAQTSTSLVGTTSITSSYGTVNVTAGTYTITPKTLTISTVDSGVTYNGVSTYNGYGDLNYSVSGLVTNFVSAAGVSTPTGDAVSGVTHNIKTGSTVASGTAVTGTAVGQAGSFNDVISGVTGINLSNYSPVYVGGAFNIAKVNLTVTQTPNTAVTYNGATQSGSTGFTYTGNLGTDTVTSLSTDTAPSGQNVGTYTGAIAGAVGSGVSNYNITYVPNTLTINPKAVTITGAVTSSTFTGSAQTNAAATVTGLVSGQSLVITGYGTGTVVGTYADTLSYTAGTGTALSNYTITSTNGSLTIGKATLTITGATTSSAYNAAVQTNTYTVTGYQNGDTASSLGLTVTGMASATHVSQGKVNDVLADTITSSNYTVVIKNGSLTITPATLSIAANNSSVTYNGATQTNVAATTTGYKGTDTATTAGLSITGYGAGKNVGTYTDSLAATVTNSDYVTSIANNGTLTITKADITLSGVTANNKVYDATTGAVINVSGATLNGLAASDAANVSILSSSTTGTFASANVANGIAVTQTALTLTGSAAGNYFLTQPTGLTANITPATLTVKGITAANKVYDATTAATLTTTGATLSGLLGSDTLTLNTSGATGTFASSHVANGINVTIAGVTVTGNATTLSNYVIGAPITTTANITPATLTITGSNSSVTYNATTQTNGAATVTGYKGSDTASSIGLSITGYASGKNANTYADNLTATITNSDYVTNVVDGSLTVAKAPLTVSGVTANNKVYDTTNTATLNVTGAILSGVFASDSGNVAASDATSTATFASVNAANGIAVTVGGIALTGTAASNYTVTQPTGLTANITPATLTVTGITAANKVYDATTAATITTTGAKINGLLGTDTLSVSSTGVTGVFASTHAGADITVTVSGVSLTGSATTLSNYVLSTPVTTTANITPATLTVVGSNTSLTYNGATQANGAATITGLKGSDAVTVSGSGSGLHAGTYTDSLSVAASGTTQLSDYAVQITQGALTITPINLTANVTVSANNRSYDATTTATGTVSLSSGVLAADAGTIGISTTGLSFADANAATGKTVTAAGLQLTGNTHGDYTLGVQTTATTTATITPANLTYTGVTTTNAYNSTTQTNSGPTLTGTLYGTDSFTLSGIASRKNVGTTADALVATANGSTVASNYNISFVQGGLTITPVTLTGTVPANAAKVYDGTTAAGSTPPLTLNLTGVYPADAATVTATVTSGEVYASANAGTGIGLSIAPSNITLNGNSLGNYVMSTSTVVGTGTITPKAVTITGATNSSVYNAATQTNSAPTVSGLVSGQSLVVSGTASGKNAGTYADSLAYIAGSGTNLSNYSITVSNGSLTITPDALNITPTITANNKTYDGTTTATGAVTVSGILAADAGLVTASASAYNFADANYGVGKTVTATGINLAGASAANYTLSTTSATTTANIDRATLTVTAQNDGKFYSQTDAVAAQSNAANTTGYNGVTYSGFVNGETSSVLGANPGITISRTGISNPSVLGATAYETVGTYANALTPTGAATIGNYAINYVTGNYTIAPAGALLVKTSGASSVYASANAGIIPASSITSVQYETTSGTVINNLTQVSAVTGSGGVINFTYQDSLSNTVTFNVTSNTTAANKSGSGNINVGSYGLTGTMTATTGSNLPVQIVATGNSVITPLAVTIAATAASNQYTAAVQTQAYTSGVIANDNVTVGGLASGTNVGTYTSSLTATGADASNYQFTLTNANLSITPATLTVSGITGVGRVYDGTTIVSLTGGTLNGALGSDAANLGLTVPATGTMSSKNVGTNAVTIAAQGLTGSASGNYTLVSQTATTATITAAPLTLSAASDSKVYDGGVTSTVAPTTSGLQNGDTISLLTQSFGSKNVLGANGSTLSVNSGYVINDGNGGNNYTVTAQTAQGTITPLAITVTAATDSRVFNGTTSSTATPTITSGSLMSGDTLTFNGQTFASKNVLGLDKSILNANAVSINDGNTVSLGNNYAVTYVSAAGTITPYAITITAATDSRSYNGTTSSTAVPTVSTLFGTDTVTGLTQAFASKNALGANNSTLTVTGYTVNDGNNGANYQVVTQTGIGTITPASLTVTAQTDTRVFNGGVNSSGTPIVSGTLYDVDSVTTNGQTFASKNVLGTGNSTLNANTVTVSDGNNGGNYSITYVPNSGTITPYTVTITPTTDTRVYNGTTSSTATPTYSTMLGTDSITGLTESFGSKNVLGTNGSVLNVGTGYTVNDGNGGSNYNVVTQTAQGTITPLALTISAATDSRVFNGTTSSTGTPTITSGSVMTGDTITINGQVFASKNVLGTDLSTLIANPVSISDTNNGSNYAITYVGAMGTITPYLVTITAASDSRAYNGTTSSVGVPTYSALFGADTIAGLTQSFASQHVIGTNGSLLNVTGYTLNDGNNGNNYTVVTQTAQGTITPAPLTVTVNVLPKTYDGTTNLPSTTALTGVLGSDSVTGSTSLQLQTSSAGVTTIVNNGTTLAGANLSDYYVIGTTITGSTVSNNTFGGATVLVAKANAVVTLNNQTASVSSPFFGGNGYTVSGLLGSDTAASAITGTITYGGTSQGAAATGTYSITGSNLSSGNYNLTYVNGVLNLTFINPVPVIAVPYDPDFYHHEEWKKLALTPARLRLNQENVNHAAKR